MRDRNPFEDIGNGLTALRLQQMQRQPRIAQAFAHTVADVEVISRPRAAAHQRMFQRYAAKHGDGDGKRPSCGVTPDQFAAAGVGQGK